MMLKYFSLLSVLSSINTQNSISPAVGTREDHTGRVEEEVAHIHTKVGNIHRCLLSYIITYYKRIELYSCEIDGE